jgi:hypothetical protein
MRCSKSKIVLASVILSVVAVLTIWILSCLAKYWVLTRGLETALLTVMLLVAVGELVIEIVFDSRRIWVQSARRTIHYIVCAIMLIYVVAILIAYFVVDPTNHSQVLLTDLDYGTLTICIVAILILLRDLYQLNRDKN